MTVKPLLAQSLAPQYTLPNVESISVSKQSLLIGQARLSRGFQLLLDSDNQHMFIADQVAIDRKLIVESLYHHHVSEAEQRANGASYLHGAIRRHQLTGTIDPRSGALTPGIFSQAGPVFICAESLWKREPLWELLLQALTDGYFCIGHQQHPFTCKVVLIGPSQLYSLAYIEERSFQQHFAILGEMVNEIALAELTKADDSHMALDQCSMSEYAQWLVTLADTHAITLAQSALTALFSYSARLAEHQQHLSLLSTPISQLLCQSAAISKRKHLDGEDIKLALQHIEFRHNASKLLSAQNFDEKFISLQTDGEVIGQINGLTVLDMAEYSYGEPARITASVHYGDGEVADIERKSELGGNIHAKGMMILSSCLYRIFGKDAPLHLNANIVFEQSYQEIDGDSASLAEYCALISAITDKPIQQGIAATGAIDQFGNVQAIGGVNEKIEGFFELCRKRGLNGNQGVIIPTANVQQLNLNQDVIKAVQDKQFSLYQVSHIDEAVELLTNVSAGEANEHNQFPTDTLYGLVQSRLEALAGYQEPELSFFERLLDKLKISS